MVEDVTITKFWYGTDMAFIYVATKDMALMGC